MSDRRRLLDRLRPRRRRIPTPPPVVDRREQLALANGLVLLHHPASDCSGPHCVLHNPSEHHMRGWPLVWRGDRGLFERTCTHGVGHPDVDSVAHLGRTGVEGADVHGCDGCCGSADGPADV